MSDQSVRVENIWGELEKYDRYLRAASSKWSRKSGFRISRDDLYGELLLVYYTIWKLYRHLEDLAFVKVLVVCLKVKCIDLIRREGIGRFISLEVLGDNFVISKSFTSYSNSFAEDLRSLVRNNIYSLRILDVVLQESDNLFVLRQRRNSDLQRRHTEIRKTDLREYMLQEGMRITDFRYGIKTLESAVELLVKCG